MSKIVWDQIGEHLYETGVKNGVLFPMSAEGGYDKGVAWNGLTSINESPSGAEPTNLYANNAKYLTLMSAEDFGGTIEAYTYPEEFAECDGSAALATGVYIGQQSRKTFGLSYRNEIGNDVLGPDYGYKLHLVYGAVASPSEKTNQTINEDPEAATMSWEFKTTPVTVTGFKPTAHLYIDSTKVDKEKLAQLEAILYGTEEAEARLPLPDEVAQIMGENT